MRVSSSPLQCRAFSSNAENFRFSNQANSSVSQQIDEASTSFSRYEFGRLISHGMIGITYLARDSVTFTLVCIKRMMSDKIAEKKIFKNVMNEISLLEEA